MDEPTEELAHHSHSHHTHPHHEHERHEASRVHPPVWIEAVCILSLFFLLPGVCGVLFFGDAGLRTVSEHKQGVITQVHPVYRSFPSRAGVTGPMYIDNEVHLANDSAAYVLFRDEYQPHLPTNLYAGGKLNEAAEIWYQQSIFTTSRPVIIAIQLQGPTQKSTRYVTEAYLHPRQTQGSEYGLALVVLLLPVLVFMCLGLWAQSRRHRKQHYPLAVEHAHTPSSPHKRPPEQAHHVR